MVREQHQSVALPDAFGLFVFLFDIQFVGAAELLQDRNGQSLALFQFSGNDQPFPSQRRQRRAPVRFFGGQRSDIHAPGIIAQNLA